MKYILFIIYITIFIILYLNTNNLDKKLYCFWTGTNPLTENRKRNLKTLKNTGFEVILVTPDNLNEYILEEHPLHKGYEYLSQTHKADYLRCYFMNFHGGGYTDIKEINDSWIEHYYKLKNSHKWGCGYAEKNAGDIAYGKNEIINKKMKENYSKLIGNGNYIFKKNTPLTNDWYEQMMKLMDEKYEELKKYPSKSPQQIHTKEYPYPFSWNELLGQIFHPLVYKYKDKLYKDLPYVNVSNYR